VKTIHSQYLALLSALHTLHVFGEHGFGNGVKNTRIILNTD
jgi:hypothetical protein